MSDPLEVLIFESKLLEDNQQHLDEQYKRVKKATEDYLATLPTATQKAIRSTLLRKAFHGE